MTAADPRDLLEASLAQLDEARLARLLAHRPDVLQGLPPRSLPDLADRLWHPRLLVDALQRVTLPALQLLEAAQALGSGCPLESLTDLLDGAGDAHAGAVRAVVDDLAGRGLLLLDPGGTLVLPPEFDDLLPSPLGLGRPVAELLGERNVGELRRVQTTLGLGRQPNRAGTVAALLAFYADQDRLAGLLAACPPQVLELLRTTSEDEPSWLQYDDDSYRLRRDAVQWAAAHGLVLEARYGFDWQVPAEVARALRGPDYRAPFTPEPPVADSRPAAPAAVERAAPAAASELAGRLLALLDHVAGRQVAVVKAGGLGTREFAKLVKTSGIDAATVRLCLELADAAGLLELTAAGVATSADFEAWRALEPGEQYAAVLRAWWELRRTPTETSDADGKPTRALARPGECDGCRSARHALFDALRTDVAVERRDCAAVVLWRAPLTHLPAQDAEQPFATVWREAELLGLIADATLTPLGEALRAARPQLVTIARGMLPDAADVASFGSDLTAYAIGTPSARVSVLLDSVADRESSGGAITWRFSPASVRRGLDAGADGDQLVDELRAIAAAELPQPLRYLLADIARRHGHLRVSTATCCVCSDDTALLAQVANDRRLAKYRLRLLAPTVLSGAVGADELLQVLRAAGYFPASDEPASDEPASDEPASNGPAAVGPAAVDAAPGRPRAGGPPRIGAGAASRPDASRADVIELFGRPRTPRSVDAPQPTDPAELAAQLLRAPRPGRADRAGSTSEKILSKLSRTLSLSEIRQLAHAIDTGARIAIDYVAASGSRTRRVIAAPELEGSSIIGWCELRQDERMFSVAGILSVAPA